MSAVLYTALVFSLFGIALLLGFRSWEIKKERTKFKKARQRLDCGAEVFLVYIKNIPRKGTGLYEKKVRRLIRYLSANLVHKNARGLSNRISRWNFLISRGVRKKGNRNNSSSFLKNIGEHKGNSRDSGSEERY